MIRILQIVPNMQSGGLETFIMNVYKNIDREKVQFDFIVHYNEKKFYDDEIEKLGGKIYRFSLRDDNNIFKYIIELNKFFRNHKEYKIVHCHMASIGFIIFLIAKKNGVKVRIAHSHNSDTEKTLKGFIKKVLMKPYKYVSTINFACSKKAGKFLFGKKHFEVIPNAINLEKFEFNEKIRNSKREELNIREENYLVGHVGRFCEQKNHKFIIDIFKEINKKDEKAILLLIGVGELKDSIKEKVKELKLEEKVIFLENRKDVNELYQAMDCFVFPSNFEGLGIVIVEAQASGLKCVCSDVVPEEANITDLFNELSLKDDPGKWAEKILENKKIDRSLVMKDVKKSKFDIKKVSKVLEDKYCKLYMED